MFRLFLTCAVVFPFLLACAPFGQTDLKSISPDQLALVDTTCTQVIGLKPWQAYFGPCRDSLAQALKGQTEGQAMATAYEECQKRGLAEGTSTFSTCMLDSKPAAPAFRPMAIAYVGGPDTEPGKSFYSVSPRVQWNRERYACAQLGLLPGSGSFGSCVASLQGAFLPYSD
jgi:hypothetical protein